MACSTAPDRRYTLPDWVHRMPSGLDAGIAAASVYKDLADTSHLRFRFAIRESGS